MSEALKAAQAAATLAVLQFAYRQSDAHDAKDFIEYWFEADFDACRQLFPHAPEECYIGADASHPKTRALAAPSVEQDEQAAIDDGECLSCEAGKCVTGVRCVTLGRDGCTDEQNAILNEQRMRDIISEVHAWAVCAAIASPADMAQNFPRIVEITSPEYKGEPQ